MIEKLWETAVFFYLVNYAPSEILILSQEHRQKNLRHAVPCFGVENVENFGEKHCERC
mgnify:FL=1